MKKTGMKKTGFNTWEYGDCVIGAFASKDTVVGFTVVCLPDRYLGSRKTLDEARRLVEQPRLVSVSA